MFCLLSLCLIQAQGRNTVWIGTAPAADVLVSISAGENVFRVPGSVVDHTSADSTLVDAYASVDQIGSADKSDIAAIVVFCGLGEYRSSIPVGDWVDVSAVRANKNGVTTLLNQRTPRFDAGTYRGRLNLLLSRLKNDYPASEVILVAPVVDSGLETANGEGRLIGDYTAAIREAGNLWSTTVVDLMGSAPVSMDAGASLIRSPSYSTNRPPASVSRAAQGCALDSRREQTAVSAGVPFSSDGVLGFSLIVM